MIWYLDILYYLWGLFLTWLHTLFVLPFTTVDMLWILVPVWLSWFFSEFFQEKVKTSMGHAMTNSVIIVWAAIDCTRQTINLINAGHILGFGNIAARFLLLLFLLAYGIVIIVLGLKGNMLIKKIGRAREITYLFVIFVPIFYDAIPFSFGHILAAIVFFPVFYYAIELIDKYTPTPKALEEDIEEESGRKTDFPMDNFGAGGQSSDPFQGNPSLNSGQQQDPFQNNQSFNMNTNFNSNPPPKGKGGFKF